MKYMDSLKRWNLELTRVPLQYIVFNLQQLVGLQLQSAHGGFEATDGP
jgi:hypothetical protein